MDFHEHDQQVKQSLSTVYRRLTFASPIDFFSADDRAYIEAHSDLAYQMLQALIYPLAACAKDQFDEFDPESISKALFLKVYQVLIEHRLSQERARSESVVAPGLPGAAPNI